MTATTADLRRALQQLTMAMDDAGLPAANLTLQAGSKTYGRAYRLHFRDPSGGGLSSVPGVYGDGFLGMTKGEAVQSLDMLAAGVRMTSPRSREAFEVRARFFGTDTTSSASRQHYVDTGHYGDAMTGDELACSVCDAR